MTSAQKMTMSNKQGGAAMQSDDPEMLRQAASLMMKQGRIKEAQALIERADMLKNAKLESEAEKAALEASAQEEADTEAERLAANKRAAVVAEEAGHTEWAKRLRTGDLSAQKYYESMAQREEDNNDADAQGRNRGEATPAGMPAGIVTLTEKAFETSHNFAQGAMEANQTLAKLDAVIDSDSFQPSGIVSTGWEKFKEFTGQEDDVSDIRTRYSLARTKAAMANLPPGTASEADVKLVMDGVPNATANYETIRNFIAALARVEAAQALYYQTKGEWWTEHRSGVGLKEHFKEVYKNSNLAKQEEQSGMTVEERERQVLEEGMLNGGVPTGTGVSP